MLAILRVTTTKSMLATLLKEVSLKAYRLDEESSDAADVIDLHYDLLDTDAASQDIQELAMLLKEKENDLRLLSESNSKLLLDLGISIYEDEYSKNLDFGVDLLKILSVYGIRLRLSLYQTAQDKH
jgi:hypothetical protein